MWNYRIMRHKHPREDYYAIHEVYYDVDDVSQKRMPRSCTLLPVDVMSETPEGVLEVLRMMLKDVEAPVLEYDEIADVSNVDPAEPESV